MNAPRNEVSEKCQHDVLDRDVPLADIQQDKTVLEKDLGTVASDVEVVFVQPRHLSRLDGFFNVPIRSNDASGGFTSPNLARTNGVRLEFPLHLKHGLQLGFQLAVLLEEFPILAVGVAGIIRLFD